MGSVPRRLRLRAPEVQGLHVDGLSVTTAGWRETIPAPMLRPMALLDGTDAAALPGMAGCDTEALRELLETAERCLELRRVYLFGSRARGDSRRDSDLDLAFEHTSSPTAWARFVNEAQDESRVLLDLDLVDLSSAPPGLRERILKEGRLLRG